MNKKLTGISLMLLIFLTLFFIFWEKLSNDTVTTTLNTLPTTTYTAAVTDFDSSLVAHYTFDDGTATDSSGHGNNGTVSGATVVDGKIGKALSFDGVSSRVSMAHDLIGASPLTICQWVYPTQNSLARYALSSRTSGGVNIVALYLSSLNNRLFFRGGGDNAAEAGSGSNAFSLNTWQDICVSRDSSGYTNIYVNGILSGAANQFSGAPITGANTTFVVGTSVSNSTFAGYVDDIRIYNRALSSTEIADIYASAIQVSSNNPDTSTPATSAPTDTPQLPSTDPNSSQPPVVITNPQTPTPVAVPTSNDIIPSDRRIDWSGAGILGGVPQRTTVCANVKNTPFNAVGNGTADDTNAIQSAIDSCPEGQVVYVPEGTYLLTKRLTVTKGIVVRGAGRDKTLIRGAIIFIKSIPYYYTPAVQSGATRGSTQIIIDDAKGFKVGMHLMFVGSDDPSIVHRQGYEGTWAESLSQVVEITSVSGTTVNFKPALYWDMDVTAPSKIKLLGLGWLQGAGLESLKIWHDNTLSSEPIKFAYTAHSWIKGVEVENSKVQAIYFLWAYDCAIRGNYLHDSTMSGSGGGYGILLEKSTGCLVENNQSKQFAADVLLDDGSAGNVVAYNYMQDIKYYDAGWNNTSFGNHSSHPIFNLWEGNVGTTYYADFIHGSASHQTLFRNRFFGWVSDRIIKQNFAIAMDAWHYDNNIVGNVLGVLGKSKVYEMSSQASTLSFASNAIYALGYAGSRDQLDPHVADSLYRHGNFDYVNNSIVWNSQVSNHVLPASLYYKDKPVWWPSSIAWPPIGPDVNGYYNKIPAQICFEQGQMPDCSLPYVATQPSVPAQPTPPPTPLTSDFNHDGLVNTLDFSLLVSSWNKSSTTYDLNGDGLVNTLDYAIMAQHWSR